MLQIHLVSIVKNIYNFTDQKPVIKNLKSNFEVHGHKLLLNNIFKIIFISFSQAKTFRTSLVYYFAYLSIFRSKVLEKFTASSIVGFLLRGVMVQKFLLTLFSTIYDLINYKNLWSQFLLNLYRFIKYLNIGQARHDSTSTFGQTESD